LTHVAEMTTVDTVLGALTIVASKTALVGVYLPDHAPAPNLARCRRVDHSPVLDTARRELLADLAGSRSAFTVPLALEGTTTQRAVWRALLDIPRGETRTYGALAAQLGRPRAARAIGHAGARNPLSIVVPCDRVVGVGGALRGFAGGLERKAALLSLDRAAASSRSRVPCTPCQP